MKAIISGIMSVIIMLASFLGHYAPKADLQKDEWNTNYTYVFVHGLMGWGEYDFVYKLMPYWGMFGGDLMKYLRKQGFDAHGASVAGTASAWDRACELYAQLTGTVVDYGVAHSEKCGHDRFGTDYTGKALIEKWSAEDKINLLGHSFGGATIRTFAHLMAKGDADEIAATPESEISPFFTGGKEDWIYSMTALAAPHNGTSSYNTGEIELDENGEEKIADYDTAAYDMYIDNALELNKKLTISDKTYYFSIPCSMTTQNGEGNWVPNESRMEGLFVDSSKAIGSFTGYTKGGFYIDESWQQNDGLVNTNSAKAPMYNASKDFDENNITKGVWNIMPVYDGDHMSLQGGMTKNNDVRLFYAEHLEMINKLK